MTALKFEANQKGKHTGLSLHPEYEDRKCSAPTSLSVKNFPPQI